ncbi:MAG: lytic transglycosylase [Gammaproteobacteria bacterium]|nr:MAG: lytic transglycosylase [Gammaproteobacteria bacterium]
MGIKSLKGLGVGLAILLTGCATTGSEQNSSPSVGTLNPSLQAATPNTVRPATPNTEPAAPEPIVYHDLWDRIRGGMKLPELTGPRVKYYERWYASRPDYMNRMINRARPYLFHIVTEVEKRGMPTEVALLPAIESAYQPKARSHARAVGMWQFIPSTGKLYGLKQNWMYEGRSDIHASTKAALDYLAKLNNDYGGDWFLSFAAYNAGEGKINRAINYNKRHGRPTSYPYLTRIRRATKAYVPKLLAIRNLIREPQKYGLNLASIPNDPYFAVVWNDKRVDINELCKRSGMSREDFFTLNPGLKRGITVPSASRNVLVAMEHKDSVRIALRALPTVKIKPRPTYSKRHKTYRVRRGDTLARIAKRHRTSVSKLKRLNGLKGSRIRVGARLKLPGYVKSAGKRYAKSRGRSRTKTVHYKVRKGDSLHRIAQRNHVSVSQIKRASGLKSNKLRVGQRLVIPGGNSAASRKSAKSHVAKARKSASKKYRVRSGDSLNLIAKRHHVTVSQIKRASGLKSNKLRVGQRLIIPGGKHATSRKSGKKRVAKAQKVNSKKYRVRSGDSLISIAKRFGVSVSSLKKHNRIRRNMIKSGQHLNIPIRSARL